MENETGSQKRVTVSGYGYEELIEKMRNRESLTDDELDDVIAEILFESIDKSNEAEREGRNAKGIKVSFLTLVGKVCGRQTKFLPMALDYRKKAALYAQDNYDRVIDGVNVAVNQGNVLLLVDQLQAADRYSESYRTLDSEIEEGLSDGLGSFRTIVGLESMIAMDKERENVLRLTRKAKVKK